ncbi:MAG: S-layer homology domain-containing protein [Faecousia sp.]
MKTKKMISALLAVCLLLSLLPALGLTAAAVEVETLYECGFETPEETKLWSFSDEDLDGRVWERKVSGDTPGSTYPHTEGNCALLSYSYDKDTKQALKPDNWAWSPVIEIPALGNTWLSYDVFAQGTVAFAEHYSVYVRVEGEGIIKLFDETLEKGEDYGSGACRNISLIDYAGKNVQIIFRHHDTTNQLAIGIDAIKVQRIVPKKIDAVAVNVDEPMVGAPITNASDIPEDYEGYTVASVQWEPNDTEFKADCSYSVLVTLEAKDDYVFPIGVTPYINERPAKIVYQGEQELKISYTFSKLLPVMPSMYFDDVKTADWFYGDVEFAYYYRLMNGVGNNKFDPNGSCTRGMIVTILYRMKGEPGHSGKNPFTDVKADQWYTDAVIWAAENGIVEGVGNGKFAPEENITREQLATILCRFAKTEGVYKEEDCTMLVGFADQSKVSSWAADSMSWAVGVGLVGGSNEKDGLYLMPQGDAQRCQVAAIFQRFGIGFAYFG